MNPTKKARSKYSLNEQLATMRENKGLILC